MKYVVVLLAAFGIIVSALALREHYRTEGDSPCSINERWDCGIVNHSSFAVIAKVPVAAIGVAGYLVLGCLGFARLRFATFLAAFLGFLFAFRLSMIEQYGLGAWCLYCAISQVIITIILLLSIGWFVVEYLALRRAAQKANI
jgi:uncharacterized membrane protein